MINIEGIENNKQAMEAAIFEVYKIQQTSHRNPVKMHTKRKQTNNSIYCETLTMAVSINPGQMALTLKFL